MQVNFKVVSNKKLGDRSQKTAFKPNLLGGDAVA
jgi:hypothetical protein